MRLFDVPRNGLRVVRNAVRSLRRKRLDYVVVPLEGSFPERASRRPSLPLPFRMLPLFPSDVSLEEMGQVLDIVAGDKRVRGVVFRVGRLQARAGTLHALRRMMLGLSREGKRTVAWLSSARTWDYYVGSACQQIIFPPSGRLRVLGLRSEALFLKDALAAAGIRADLESIAEYKTAPDMYRRSAMSEPHREMLEAVLESYYAELVTSIAEARGLAEDQVRNLIDAMPMAPDEAVSAGLVDATLYEDELAQYLLEIEDEPDGDEAEERAEAGVPLVTWQEASRWLKRPPEWTTRKRVGVVSLEGLIVPGTSRRMPAPLPLPVEAQAGAETITRALRQAEADRGIAAVIFHVESPGGSSLASDLIWREVRRLAERKPVVVLMGDQATSGGYYVSAAANRIVARPTTMTGSIGIWGGKFVLGELYDMLQIGRQAVTRGEMAGLESEMEPFTEEERERVREELTSTYSRFRRIVAEGRGMTEEDVEKIARGRVWTGAQAVEIGLVDELGDFDTALTAAKKLTGLEPEETCTVVPVAPPGGNVLPLPFPADSNSAWWTLRPLFGDLARDRVWAMAPWIIRVRG